MSAHDLESADPELVHGDDSYTDVNRACTAYLRRKGLMAPAGSSFDERRRYYRQGGDPARLPSTVKFIPNPPPTPATTMIDIEAAEVPPTAAPPCPTLNAVQLGDKIRAAMAVRGMSNTLCAKLCDVAAPSVSNAINGRPGYGGTREKLLALLELDAGGEPLNANVEPAPVAPPAPVLALAPAAVVAPTEPEPVQAPALEPPATPPPASAPAQAPAPWRLQAQRAEAFAHACMNMAVAEDALEEATRTVAEARRAYDLAHSFLQL